MKKIKCKTCKHELRYHATPSEHILGTSHCTKFNCVCTELVVEE